VAAKQPGRHRAYLHRLPSAPASATLRTQPPPPRSAFRVELAGLGKFHNPNRDKLRNGQCLGTGQPQSGTNLFKGFMHRFDLVRAKERRAAASAVDCFAQLEVPPARLALGAFMTPSCDRFVNMRHAGRQTRRWFALWIAGESRQPSCAARSPPIPTRATSTATGTPSLTPLPSRRRRCRCCASRAE
jgi:hypothetical protein